MAAAHQTNSVDSMSTVSPFAERVQDVFGQPRDVLGLAAELLALCCEHDLRLDWRNGKCKVFPSAPSPEESVDVPITESAFRAVLARIAALCNERLPHSVSPYGGRGEVAVDGGAASVCHVAYSNRPGDLWLTMKRGDPQNASSPCTTSPPARVPSA